MVKSKNNKIMTKDLEFRHNCLPEEAYTTSNPFILTLFDDEYTIAESLIHNDTEKN